MPDLGKPSSKSRPMDPIKTEMSQRGGLCGNNSKPVHPDHRQKQTPDRKNAASSRNKHLGAGDNPAIELIGDHKISLQRHNNSEKLKIVPCRSKSNKKQLNLDKDKPAQMNCRKASFNSTHRIHNNAKRKSAIDSPSRRLNKKLVYLISELRKSNEYYRHELKTSKAVKLQEILELQKDNEVLSRENVKLTEENAKWKQLCQKQENKNVSIAKAKTLAKENNEFKEDLEVYKSVVCRLNRELSAYQDKLKIQAELCHDSMRGELSCPRICASPEINNAFETPRKRLFPLLLAYDEVIKEKNEIIQDHEKALAHFKSKCKEIVQENQDLHEQISKREQKGMVSIEEWQFLHSNSLVVLEENDILHEKIELFHKKEDVILKSHETKVHKLKGKISNLQEENTILKSAMDKTGTHCKSLLFQQAKLSEMLEKQSIDQHEASVQECKTLFEELKSNYNSERTLLMEKLESMAKEKNRLTNAVSELEAKNGRLQTNLQTCEDTLENNAVQFRELYTKMTDATKARDVSTSAMQETMELSQRIISEREDTERLLQEQRILNENLIQLRERHSILVIELQQKIKDMEDIHSTEIEKLLRRVSELEIVREEVGMDSQQRIACLESLVEEKNKRIETLDTEKRQLQADLETVWKTTTCTIKDITANGR